MGACCRCIKSNISLNDHNDLQIVMPVEGIITDILNSHFHRRDVFSEYYFFPVIYTHEHPDIIIELINDV